MSESKHTLGEWTPYSDGHVIDIRPAATGASESSTITRLYPSTPLPERWANARLIAAAPQMLEAHEADAMDAHDALARLPSAEWVGHAETRDIMALIGKLRERLVAIARRSDAAIAAATGGEQ